MLHDKLRALPLKKLKILIAVCAITITLFSFAPISPFMVYEAIFDVHYKTTEFMQFETTDFGELTVERSDFKSNGITLAGYKYKKPR